jgi:hypothetical protein
MVNQLQQIVLEHIHTYGMTIPQAVANVFGLGVAEATETLQKLSGQKFVKSGLLTPTTEYFYLQPKAAEVLRVGKVYGRPFKPLPKISAYGMLHFCCLEDTYRPRIPEAVWETRFKNLYHGGPKNYYTEGRKLGYVRIDSHALGVNPRAKISGDPFRVIDTCWKDVDKRQGRYVNKWQGRSREQLQENEPFVALVESGQFVVMVLTAFEERAQRIRARIERMKEERALYISVRRDKEAGKFVEKELYHRYEKIRRAKRRKGEPEQEPRAAPPMEVHAIPDLFELMYPTTEPSS